MAQQAFDTAEPLEAILMKLPMKDLLFSQKVCKQWKKMMDSSIRIRRKLYIHTPQLRKRPHRTFHHLISTESLSLTRLTTPPSTITS